MHFCCQKDTDGLDVEQFADWFKFKNLVIALNYTCKLVYVHVTQETV